MLVISTVALGMLSGCTELVSGEGPISREASPGEVEQSVLDETGHELEDQREETISREFEVGGQTRQVEATFNGERIPVYIHVGSVAHGDDIVIGAGAYPQALESSEEAAMGQLFGGIVHPAE